MKRLLFGITLAVLLAVASIGSGGAKSAFAGNDYKSMSCQVGEGCHIHGVMSYGYAVTTVYGWNYATNRAVINTTMTVCFKQNGCALDVDVPGEANVLRYAANLSTSFFGLIVSIDCRPGGFPGGGGGGGSW